MLHSMDQPNHFFTTYVEPDGSAIILDALYDRLGDAEILYHACFSRQSKETLQSL